MSIITNKEFLVDFHRILRVVDHDRSVMPADGLLENQTVYEGYDAVEVLSRMMWLTLVSKEYETGLSKYHIMMSALNVIERFGQN